MGSGPSSSILIVLLSTLLTHSLSMQDELYEGSYCKLENGKMGVCKKIYECPSRLREVMEGKRTADSTGRCGFENFTEIVCCKLNITEKIRLRPAEIACQQYENEIADKEQLRREDVEFHIFGGTEADRGEFPYMVALGYEISEEDDEEESNSTYGVQYNCGGTLISSQHVLTAAHCISNIQEKVPIEVRVGSKDLTRTEGGAQRISINNTMIHPRYKRSLNYNDVAILKLSTSVRMTSNVRPICIQTKSLTNTDVPQSASFVVIGWGATSYQVKHSARLMKTPSLSLVDRESCARSYEDLTKLPRGLDDNMLCALDANVTRKSDSCLGDSGGPLLMIVGPNHSVVGVTAFGQKCGGSAPSVYTAVYPYLKWIEEQVWPDMIDD